MDGQHTNVGVNNQYPESSPCLLRLGRKGTGRNGPRVITNDLPRHRWQSIVASTFRIIDCLDNVLVTVAFLVGHG